MQQAAAQPEREVDPLERVAMPQGVTISQMVTELCSDKVRCVADRSMRKRRTRGRLHYSPEFMNWPP